MELRNASRFAWPGIVGVPMQLCPLLEGREFSNCVYFGKMGWIVRIPSTSTATSLTVFPVSLSISSSHDLGSETALLVPTWMTFLIRGVLYHL